MYNRAPEKDYRQIIYDNYLEEQRQRMEYLTAHPVTNLADLITALKSVHCHAHQFQMLALLDQVKKREFSKFIKNRDDYFSLLRALEPSLRDHVAGLSLDFVDKNSLFASRDNILFSVPDFGQERPVYMEYYTCDRNDSGGKWIAGLLPASIKTIQDLASILSYVPCSLFPNYIVWHARLFSSAENIEILLKTLSLARSSLLLQHLGTKIPKAFSNNFEAVSACATKLPLKKARLLLATFGIPRALTEYDSMFLRMVTYLDRLSGAAYLSLPSLLQPRLPLSDAEISLMASYINNAKELAETLANCDHREQDELLNKLAIRLASLIRNDEEYRNVCNQIAEDHHFNFLLLSNCKSLNDLIRTIRYLQNHNAYMGHDLPGLSRAIHASINTADEYKTLCEAFPHLSDVFLNNLRHHAFAIIHSREDFLKVAPDVNSELKRMMESDFTSFEELARLYNVAPLKSLYEYISYHSVNGGICTDELWANFAVRENLVLFFKIQSLDRCELFMNTLHYQLVATYGRKDFLDICKSLEDAKGRVLFQLYEKLNPPVKPGFFTMFNPFAEEPCEFDGDYNTNMSLST